MSNIIINQNCGPYRLTNRNCVTRTQREPIGKHKTDGPRLGLDPWIFGHEIALKGLVPAVGLERKALGLTTSNTRPRLPQEDEEVTVVTTKKRGAGAIRGKGRRKRKQKRDAEIFARQDAQVAKIRKRDRQRAKLARDREMSSLVQVGRQIQAGNLVSLINNSQFEVVS